MGKDHVVYQNHDSCQDISNFLLKVWYSWHQAQTQNSARQNHLVYLPKPGPISKPGLGASNAGLSTFTLSCQIGER